MKPLWAIILVVISTVCYNLPSQFYNMGGYDTTAVPEKFYSFYCLFIALQLLLIAIYAFWVYWLVPINNFKTKLILLLLFIEETVTFVDHVLRKYILFKTFSDYQRFITLGIFSVCCLFIIQRAFKKLESDKFRPDRTYVINFLPKDWRGLFNYIIRCSGHKAIYQNGFIVGFSKNTGLVIQKIAYPEKIIGAYLKEIPKIDNLSLVLGKRYNLIKFNCNHLIKYATKRS